MFGSAHRARRMAKAARSAVVLVAAQRRDVHERPASGESSAPRAATAHELPLPRRYGRREGGWFLVTLCTVVLALALVVVVRLEALGLPERVLSAATPYAAVRDQACVDFAPTGWWSYVLMTLQHVACAKGYSMVYDDGGQVTVVDFPGRRVLLFGTQVETEVDVDARGRYTAPSEYIRTIAALIRRRFPAAAAAADPDGSLLLMGVGGGSLFMELLLHNYTRLQMLGLDDDAHILELRERFFDGLLEPLRTADTRIQFVHAEAAAFLLNTSAPAHTVIVNDCYVKIRDDLPPEVMTEQFTQRVHGRLTEGGAYFVNVLSHYNGSGAEPHAAVAATVRRVFGNVQVFVSDSQALPVVPYYWKYQQRERPQPLGEVGQLGRRFGGAGSGGTELTRQVLKHNNAMRRMGHRDDSAHLIPVRVQRHVLRKPMNQREHNTVVVGVAGGVAGLRS